MKYYMKSCWVAKRYCRGWRLGFAVGNSSIQYLPKVWFKDKKDIDKALRANCVFVWMAGDKPTN